MAGRLKRALDESGQLDEIKGSLYKLKRSERVVCALSVPLYRPRDKTVIQNLPLTCQDKWQRKKVLESYTESRPSYFSAIPESYDIR